MRLTTQELSVARIVESIRREASLLREKAPASWAPDAEDGASVWGLFRDVELKLAEQAYQGVRDIFRPIGTETLIPAELKVRHRSGKEGKAYRQWHDLRPASPGAAFFSVNGECWEVSLNDLEEIQ